MFENTTPGGGGAGFPMDAARGRNPMGGKTFYMSNLGHGSDSNEGTDPEFPLATIAQALTLCTQRRGDYIFVQDSYDQESSPLVLNIRNVHLIGLGNGGHLGTRALITGSSAPAIRTNVEGGSYELAGFRLSAPGSYPCIDQVGAVWTGHIHHCSFGEILGAQDGIFADADEDLAYMTVDHCHFGYQLTRDGIRAGNASRCHFLDNTFLLYQGDVGINCTTGNPGGVIARNAFGAVLGASAGYAITIGGFGFLVTDNRASDTGDGSGNNPYKDNSGSAAGDRLNAWVGNYEGNALTAVA